MKKYVGAYFILEIDETRKENQVEGFVRRLSKALVTIPRRRGDYPFLFVFNEPPKAEDMIK